MPEAGPNNRLRHRPLTAARLWAPRLIGAALLAWAAVVLWRDLHALDPHDIAAHMRAWGPWRIVLAVGLGAVSFGLTDLTWVKVAAAASSQTSSKLEVEPCNARSVEPINVSKAPIRADRSPVTDGWRSLAATCS